MTRFAASGLDLSQLPAPVVVETLDYEGVLAERTTDLVARFEGIGVPYDVEKLETDSAVIGQQVDAGREIKTRGRVNDAASAVMLARAVGADLEQLGALFGVVRLEGESDDRLRRRIQLAPEAYSAAGSEASYIYHALTASAEIIDARPILYQTTNGQLAVRVVCLSATGSGAPSLAALAAARAVLTSKNVRPMTVPVFVSAPTIVDYALVVRIVIPDGPDPALVKAAAIAGLTAMVAERRGLGVDIQLDAYRAAARVSGVERVIIDSPIDRELADDEVGYVTAITVTAVSLIGEVLA